MNVCDGGQHLARNGVPNVRLVKNAEPRFLITGSPDQKIYERDLIKKDKVAVAFVMGKVITFMRGKRPFEKSRHRFYCMSNSTCTEGQLSPINNSPGPRFTANLCLRETSCLLGCRKIVFTKNISTKMLI
jgi:hypothetical protein